MKLYILQHSHSQSNVPSYRFRFYPFPKEGTENRSNPSPREYTLETHLVRWRKVESQIYPSKLCRHPFQYFPLSCTNHRFLLFLLQNFAERTPHITFNFCMFRENYVARSFLFSFNGFPCITNSLWNIILLFPNINFIF